MKLFKKLLLANACFLISSIGLFIAVSPSYGERIDHTSGSTRAVVTVPKAKLLRGPDKKYRALEIAPKGTTLLVSNIKGSYYYVVSPRPSYVLKSSVQVVDQVSKGASSDVNSFSEAKFDDTLIRHSVGNLFKLIEGAFGALIMVVAGLAAIIAAAMGAYRAAVGMLVVAVGAFILRALVSLFFGTDYTDYQVNRPPIVAQKQVQATAKIEPQLKDSKKESTKSPGPKNPSR